MSATDDPLPPDPWLREALRHAPDAQAGPSPKLDDHILRMGRAAVAPRPAPAPPAPPTLGQRLLAAWDWLARPPVAAGFASVLVATVVGVMWWGRPLQETLPPREEPVAAAAPETAAAPPARSTEAGAPVAAAPAPAPAPRVAELSRGAPEPKPAARKSAAPDAAAPAAPPPPAAVAQDQAAPRDAAREKAEEAAMTGRRALESRAEMAAPPAPAGAAAPAAAAPPGGIASALAGSPAALGALRARAAAGTIETPGLSNLRFEIKPRAQAWTWQRDDGAERPMDEAMQDWIALADRTARPHWNPGAAAGEGATTTLRFRRDGSLKATLRIGPKGLRLDRAGKTESAELSTSQTTTLAGALDALGP